MLIKVMRLHSDIQNEHDHETTSEIAFESHNIDVCLFVTYRTTKSITQIDLYTIPNKTTAKMPNNVVRKCIRI